MSIAVSVCISDKFYCVVDQEVIGVSEHRGYWEYLFKIGALPYTGDWGPEKLVRVDDEQDIVGVLVGKSLRKKAFEGVHAEDEGLTPFELFEVLETIDWLTERVQTHL